jgi:hypothetical protein
VKDPILLEPLNSSLRSECTWEEKLNFAGTPKVLPLRGEYIRTVGNDYNSILSGATGS